MGLDGHNDTPGADGAASDRGDEVRRDHVIPAARACSTRASAQKRAGFEGLRAEIMYSASIRTPAQQSARVDDGSLDAWRSWAASFGAHSGPRDYQGGPPSWWGVTESTRTARRHGKYGALGPRSSAASPRARPKPPRPPRRPDGGACAAGGRPEFRRRLRSSAHGYPLGGHDNSRDTVELDESDPALSARGECEIVRPDGQRQPASDWRQP